MATSPSMSVRKAAYWASTACAALALAAAGAADLVRAHAVMESLAHLGYPAYFATIRGTWELLGAAAILAPDRPRLKERAYAGMFFALTGAAMSHAISGDASAKIGPLVLLAAVIVSYSTRPARRAFFPAEIAAPRAA